MSVSDTSHGSSTHYTDRQSLISPVSTTRKYASQPHNIDWNDLSGLQVYDGPTTGHGRAGSGIEAVNRHENGLIPAEGVGSFRDSETGKETLIEDNRVPVAKYDMAEKEPMVYGSSGGKGTSPRKKGAALPFWKRRRPLVLGAVILIVLIVLAAVLGGVLGSRTNKSGTNDGASSNSGVPASNGVSGGTKNNTSRMRSTQGAWNGTGIAVIYQNQNLTKQSNGHGLFIYQDYQGDVKTMRTNFDGAQQGTVSTEPARSAGIEAAWGTGLAAVTIPIGDSLERYVIAYVCNNGTLCDAWTDSGSPNGPWLPGGLSALNFQVPLDYRPTMYMEIAKCWDKSNTSYGMHLWAGSTDNKVSQYSYDVPSGAWNDDAYSIGGTYAFGGLVPDIRECHNTTLYTTNQDGLLQYLFQDANPAQQWPLGGSPFSDPVESPGRPGAGHPWSGIDALFFDDVPNNSHQASIVYVINSTSSDNESIPLEGPTLGRTYSNVTQFATSFWEDGNASEYYPIANSPAMPGTDLKSYNLFHYTTGDRYAKIIFWQDTGSTIRWRLYDGSNTFHNGTLVQ